MANNYNIGTGTGQITLAVDITTIGLAATRASVLVVSGTSPGVSVAYSVDATGDIAPKAIGAGQSLKGKRLMVFTQVTLTGSNASDRANEAAAVRGDYTLSGGDAGVKHYNNPIKSYQDPHVFVAFVVDLV